MIDFPSGLSGGIQPMNRGNAWRFAIISIFALAGSFVLQHEALGKSALAVGLPPNVATQGVSVGSGYNYDTTVEIGRAHV